MAEQEQIPTIPPQTIPPQTIPNPQDQKLVIEDKPIQSAAPELNEDEQILSLDTFDMSDEEIAAAKVKSKDSEATSEGEGTSKSQSREEVVPSSNEPAPATTPALSDEDAKIDSAATTTENTLDDVLSSIFSETAATAPKPEQRNFEGLAEEEKHLMKQMSNDAYNKYYPEILQLRKQAQNASAYNNPEAYKLTPEYTGAVDEYSKLSDYIGHLEGQLMRPDGKLVPLQVDANGNVTTGAELDISETDKMQVQQSIAQLQQQQQQYLASVETIKNQFHTQYTSRRDQIRGLLNKFSPDALQQDTPESVSMTKYLANIGLEKDMLAPVVGVYHNTLVKALRENVSLKQQLSTGQRLAAEQQAAGPTKSQASGDQTTKANDADKDEMYTAADMATTLSI